MKLICFPHAGGFAFYFNFIKQIETLPGHRMLLRSLNERYEPIEVDLRGDMAESVRIIGKVIWWCREA